VAVCPNCASENPEGSRFCLHCGTTLGQTCPNCGASLPGDARFCNVCGTALEGQGLAAAPPATQPSTERRLVSVLFADLVGFTALSESRDPEDVRDLLSRYFETCRMIVERYGGTVEKFIGDAAMAVWGTPVASEDDAERAVRAGLELLDAVTALGEQFGMPGLQARAGVLSGEAAVNLGAQGQGMVAGDLVNTASRIQSAAEPGSVLVGDSTRRLTEAGVAYADGGTHELKGKAEPVRLWRALRVVAGRGGLMKSEGLEAPFVGRDREMKVVKDLFHACIEEGKAHLIRVTGIAGIGKSRLVWEFFKYMDGLRQLFLWHRGRSLAYGEGVTYWALAEMVRGRAGIVEGEDRASALAKLHEAVDRYVEGSEDRAFVEPRLAHLIGLQERTAPEKSDLFAGWRLFFERLAERDPVLLVFEDMQWADPSLVEFIDYLLEWSKNHRLFIMALARPETMGDSLGAPKRNATSIFLEPLPSRAMEQLLTGLVPGLPVELTAKILERAEGVPLYAVETVRMLLDREMLVQEGPVYRPTGPIEALDVPETLHALIAARLDGLSAAERRLVQDAAVLGKTFTKPALAALTGIPESELEPLLGSLVVKEVLSVQADPRSPEIGQYGFLQDLVRTVAYETLAKRDRKSKHLAVAAYLERAWGKEEEEIVEIVASHYLEAYRLAPEAEDATDVRDRARRMLLRAAERAASLAAAEEAQTYFRQAADLTNSALERAEHTERAGQMAYMRGRLEEASGAYEEATRLFEEAGQPHAAARVQSRLGEVEFVGGHLEQALERMRTAHAVLSGDEPDPDLATVAAQLGRFLALSGRHEEAVSALEEALELAEHLELREVYSHALSSRAVALLRRDRLDEAGTLLRRALDVALEHNLTAAAFRAYNNLAVTLHFLDRFGEVAELTERALELARRTGDRAQELSWLSAIGALLMIGRWDQALSWGQEVMDAEEISSLWFAASRLVDLVPLHIRRGELQDARASLEWLSGTSASDNWEFRSAYLLAEAELLRAEGEPAQSLVRAQQIVDGRAELGLTHITVKLGLVEAIEAALDLADAARADELLGIVRGARPGEVTPYLRAHAARLAARLAALRHEDDTVQPGFLAAEQGFRDLHVPFDLAVALLEHAEWLIDAGRPDEAGPLLSEAAEIFERLGAKPWIERASRVKSALPLVREA
jgi:predicted ATPase/class 3 adenylate cyclase